MMPNAERRGKTNKEPTKNETQMNSLKKLLLAAALLMSGACVVNAQEKTTTAGVPVVELNNGVEMPRFGLGTFLQGSNEVCKQSCLTALRTGYRHIDTAHAYNDEEGVGQAVKESGIPRSEIWITSKLWPTEYGEGKTLRAIDAMLDRMQLDYIDLLYVHQPVGDYLGAWRDMEKAVKMGKVRALGISNFDTSDEAFDEIMEKATIKPAVLQMECHPYAQRVAVRWEGRREWHPGGVLVSAGRCPEPGPAAARPRHQADSPGARQDARPSHPALAHPGGFLRHPRRHQPRLHQGEHPNFRLHPYRRRDAANTLAQQGAAHLGRHARRREADGLGKQGN